MTPELKTVMGRVVANISKKEHPLDLEEAERLASGIQKLIDAKNYTVAKLVLKNTFPSNYASEFFAATLARRTGSIKYTIQEDGEIRVNEIYICKNSKQKKG